MSLEFAQDSHTYRLDGRPVPHVTGVLKANGFVDDSYFTEYAAERGRKVHLAIQYYDDGCLKEDSLDPVLRPYLDAWIRFKAESHFVCEKSEIQVASKVHLCAGTVDKLGRLFVGTPQETPAIIDIKTGEVHPWVALQLMGYLILLGEPLRKRYAVQLTDEGTYRLHHFKERTDRAVFLAALTVQTWKEYHGC